MGSNNCEICLEDISHRNSTAKYCRECFRQLTTIRSMRNYEQLQQERMEKGLCIKCGAYEAVENEKRCRQCKGGMGKYEACVICDKGLPRHRMKYCKDCAHIVQRKKFEKFTPEQVQRYHDHKDDFGYDEEIVEELREKFMKELRQIHG